MLLFGVVSSGIAVVVVAVKEGARMLRNVQDDCGMDCGCEPARGVPDVSRKLMDMVAVPFVVA